MTSLFLYCGCVALMLVGCAHGPAHESTTQQEIRAALEKQVAEWNTGNLAGFMETYAKSESTRFASGGNVSMGWHTVFERYRKRYGVKETMGKLKFSDIDVQVLGADAALAFGRWDLRHQAGDASGLFTLVLHKHVEGWRIVHDHTSAATP